MQELINWILRIYKNKQKALKTLNSLNPQVLNILQQLINRLLRTLIV